MAWIAAVAAAASTPTGKKRPITKADKIIGIFGLGSMLSGLIIFMWAFLGESFMFSGVGIVMWIVVFTLGISMVMIACIPVEHPKSRETRDTPCNGKSRSSTRINRRYSAFPERTELETVSYYKNLSPVSSTKQFCKNCGLKLEQDDRFCYSCGLKIKDTYSYRGE